MRKILYFSKNTHTLGDFETYQLNGKHSPAFQVYTVGEKWFLQRFSKLAFPDVDAIIIDDFDDFETIEFLINCFQHSGYPLYIWTDANLEDDLITDNEIWNRVSVSKDDDGKLELLYACTVLQMSHTIFFHE